jgi:DNA repair photolyase
VPSKVWSTRLTFMMDNAGRKRKGRGAATNPPNRFVAVRTEPDFEHLDDAEEQGAIGGQVKTEYFDDATKSVVSENDSPDVPFRYSLNPYRGCSHGCSYCYARPTHEYLGFSAGLDFESKILVKKNAAKLFRDFLAHPKWQPEPIALSGVTDPYQPGERDFQVTRQCLEVALAARQPLNIITKNALILRDSDLLSEMAGLGIVRVAISVTTLDADLARSMEPRTSTPDARLKTIQRLSNAGIPVQVMVAPIIPGLNDSEIPSVLRAAASAGAMGAGYVLLRLPFAVKPIFLAWLDEHRPNSRKRIESAIRATRGGALTSSSFGQRMKGSGLMAKQIAQMFCKFSKSLGLDGPLSANRGDLFRPPISMDGQGRLF